MNLTIIYQTQFFKNTQEQDAHYYFSGMKFSTVKQTPYKDILVIWEIINKES